MKHLIKIILATAILTTTTTGWAGTNYEDINQSVQVDRVIKMQLLKVRDKYKKGRFDFSIEVFNLSGKPVVYYYGEMRCERDGERGRLDYPFFGAGERSIDLKPGETKRFNYSCKTDRKKKPGQTFTISLGRILENPNNDGLTGTKVLSKGLSMSIDVTE